MKLIYTLVLSLWTVVSFFLLGCAGDQEPRADELLRATFPREASLVLDGPFAFGRVEAGGINASARAARGEASERIAAAHIEAHLPPHRKLSGGFPDRGDSAVHFRLEDGFELRVHEEGAGGEAELAGGAVAYRREGGAVFWTRTAAGYEEWLFLEPGHARADRAVSAWTLEGGSARQEDRVVLIVDEQGAPKLRVAAPRSFAASGREVEARLVVTQPDRIELYVDGGGERVLVDPSWTPTGSHLVPRDNAAAVKLPSGQVLLAAGTSPSEHNVLPAEIYDPKTDVWLPAGTIAHPAWDPEMTLLSNGQVFMIGGIYNSGASTQKSAITQIFDPGSKTWALGSSMIKGRSAHTVTRLADSRVLVAGGGFTGGELDASAEVYNPVTKKWTATPPMIVPRYGPASTLLPNGKVLVTGGETVQAFVATKSAEVYDPVANTWTQVASMNRERLQHAHLLLPNGKVLVAGAFDLDLSDGKQVTPADAEIYDPEDDTWKVTSPMPVFAGGVSLSLLPSGKVLLIHGLNIPGEKEVTLAQIYDPEEDVWTVAKPPLAYHHRHHAVSLDDGRMLLTGGYVGFLPPYAELYDPGALNGEPCVVGDDCETGFCAAGVCCDSACDGGPCEACSIAMGAPEDGVCAKLTGVVCSDGDACTSMDTCNAGECRGTPRVCEPIDACHEGGACDSETGLCLSPRRPDGSSCSDGGMCEDGACVGAGDPSTGAGAPSDLSAQGGCGCRSAGSSGGAGVLVWLLVVAAASGRRAHVGARRVYRRDGVHVA